MARRMGYEEYFPWKEPEEAMDFALAPIGLSIEKLAQHPEGIPQGGLYDFFEQGFRTPSGKIEIYSSLMDKYHYDPLPVHIEPEESPVSTPELFKEYPIILTTGARILEYYHGQFRQTPKLRSRVPEPLLDLHPDTAKEYAIEDGDMVLVETKRGQISIKAHVTEDIAKGVAMIPHGWNEANVNLLTDETPCDPICGFPAVKSLLCKINKIT